MASFVVMQRRQGAGARPETVLVRDRFSIVAFIIPLVWLLWHRLWFAALMLLIVSGTIGLIGEYVAPGMPAMLAGFAVSAFVALEGPAWRIARFRRKGFAEAGTVVAPDLDEAEIRWFTGRGARRTPPPLPAVPFGRTVPAPGAEPHSDMLFGFAGSETR